MRKFLIIYLFFALGLLATAQAEIKPYRVGGLNKIQSHYEGQAFLLILWSHDCPPCRKELEYLEMLQQQQAITNVVLVNTDGSDEFATVEKILNAHQLLALDNWIFANPNIEKLRYSIDPNWAGELPKSYFYNATHERQAKSGSLSIEVLQRWLEKPPQ